MTKPLKDMTAEDLHNKGEIALELAIRDRRIAELEREIERMRPVVEAAFAWRRSEPDCGIQICCSLEKYEEGK